jgi:hypothetical protein
MSWLRKVPELMAARESTNTQSAGALLFPLFSPSRVGWCSPHLGQFFLSWLIVSGNAFTDTAGGGFLLSTSNPIKLNPHTKDHQKELFLLWVG